MMGEQAGVQQKVCEHYENAHYVQCYTIMQQATSHIPAVRVFRFLTLAVFLPRHPNALAFLTRLLQEGCQDHRP